MKAHELGKPCEDASAWKGAVMAGRTDWIWQLSDSEIDEIEHALSVARAAGGSIPGLTRAQFPLAKVAERLKSLRDEVMHGRGFTLIRGLPIERYSTADAALIYWGIGLYLGEAYAQNAQGDLLGHVRDLRADYKSDMRARGYQTRSMLPFHNDSQDIVGLLCLRRAKHGGLSRIVSSTAVHNAVLERRPDLYKVLSEPFCIDRRGEEPEGKAPYYKGAPFEVLDGRLFIRFNRTFYESAQRHPGVPPLTEGQKQALDLMDELCNDPEYYLQMDLIPGDMQFINNYVVLHSRTEYEDWPEPERKRHLLRLWLRTGAYPKIPASYLERYGDMRAWQQTPKAPIFDVTEIHTELAH